MSKHAPAPLPSSENLKNWTDILTPWIQVIGLLAAGIFALSEYYDHNREQKIQRSIDYVSRLNSGDLLTAQTKLSVQVQKLNPRLRAIFGDSKLSEDQINVAYYRFVLCELLRHDGPQSQEDNFFALNGFLEDGVACSKQKLCDEKTLRDYIGGSGKVFVRTYYPYYCYLRISWNDQTIGASVERFYNPPVGDACHDYEESARKTGETLNTCPQGGNSSP
jgi:hypothetical protein